MNNTKIVNLAYQNNHKDVAVAAATIEEYRTCRESVGGVVYGEPKNQT